MLPDEDQGTEIGQYPGPNLEKDISHTAKVPDLISYLCALMAFLFPGFLFALFSLSIPILIHLFNFRRYKTVFFTNVRFLKEVKEETRSRNRLKHLLILLARLLALAALIFAFAQPFLPAQSGNQVAGIRAISIYVDNSFSMDAIGKNGPLLEDARNKAREIASSFSASDRFQLLTNDFEGKHQRMLSKDEFLEMLDEVKLSATGKNLDAVMLRQKDALNRSGIGNKSLYLLSDFQRSIFNPDLFPADTAVRVNLVPLESQTRNNVYVDSIWFPSPVRQIGKNDKVFVRLRNLSSNVLSNQPLKLFINGQQRSPTSYTLEPGASGESVLSFVCRDPGIYSCRVEINDHPLTFDDRYYFSFTLNRHIPVLSINGNESDSTSRSLRAVFSDSLFLYKETSAKKIDYSSFQHFGLIVLNGLKEIPSGLSAELNKFLNGGGSLLLFPGTEIVLSDYRSFLAPLHCPFPETTDSTMIKVGKLLYEHPLFEDVFDKQPENPDLPVVQKRYKLSTGVRSTMEPLMQLQNGEVFMGVCRAGNGKIILASVPLSPAWSSFSRHALFVPVLFQAALHSKPYEKLYHIIGSDQGVEGVPILSGGENIYHIRDGKEFDLIPGSRNDGKFSTLFPGSGILKDGNYFLYSGDSLLKGISFNYDRKESDPACYVPGELTSALAENSSVRILEPGERSMGDLVKVMEQGTPLWKWFIILCLLFLGTEVCLIRFMK